MKPLILWEKYHDIHYKQTGKNYKPYVVCLQHSHRELKLYVKYLLIISCKMYF
jgi:hypothetical protein